MPDLLTDGLYITRKRKKWKFAHFDSYPNCFTHLRDQNPNVTRKNITTYFGNFQVPTLEITTKPLVLEIAAGNAQFSYQLAKNNPECNFIAIDIKSDRLYTSAKQALEEKVENIAFVRMSLHELSRVFPENTVDIIWLTFPDPFMRTRSIRRRLSHPLFLRQYREILKTTGKLKFKTDNRELFLWSLEQLVTEKWQFEELNFDLHESDLPKEYKIMTYYEKKFIDEGFAINYVGLTANKHET